MALYNHFATLFMNKEMSDLRLRCNGSNAIMPIHRVVLAAQSPILRSQMAANEARDMTMVLSDDDPSIVIKFLSILYRGNYDDSVFGETSAAHIATTWPLDKIWSFIGGRGTGWQEDKKDQRALYEYTQAHDMSEPETWAPLFESFKDAFYLYMMAKKYQCPIAGVIAHDRFHDILDLFLDKEEYDEVDLQMLIDFIDELYVNTVSGDNLRKEICVSIKRWDIKCPDEGRRFRIQCAELIRIHPEFAADMTKA
ncbi:hypothetical protein G7054_g10189 [Neopestalotiopsis clavispora]|nr:hypothetical protein G7054_g10189 [Neopestalotiopsis clavispora]